MWQPRRGLSRAQRGSVRRWSWKALASGTMSAPRSQRPPPADSLERASGVDGAAVPKGAAVIVGLGGNLGSPERLFSQVIRTLGEKFAPVSVSSLYTSLALGPEQPDFLNAAVCLHHPGPLHELLLALQILERDAGRVRTQRWGPRTLDLDILWAQNRTEQTSSLTVPHPELLQRAFALRPLLDVFPASVGSECRRLYEEAFERLGDQQVTKCGRNFWWEGVP